MYPRTVFLCRLLGLYLLLCGLGMMVHRQVYVDAMTKLAVSPAALLCVAAFVLVAGLAMVLGHNLWTKCPAVVVVTVVGWLTLIKGIAYLLLPASWLGCMFQAAFHSGAYFYAATTFALVLGAYLTIEGFRAKPA
jgi:hypothetical protein